MADKAVLIGINKYPGAPLNGCVNDITDMAAYLTSKCNFNPKTIRMLTDGRATTSEILVRINWLVSDLKAGDRIFLHYSGHGAQVATRDATGEVDGLDEVICPVDFDWSDEHMIRDKQFHEIFAKIPAGVQAIFLSDSCHSGDLSRGFLGLGRRLPRRMLPPEDIAWRNSTAKKASLAPRAYPNIALISGCKSDQTSADAFINKRYNGACTYMLLQSLKAKPINTLQALVADMNDRLKKSNYEQQPQLEGPDPLKTQRFFI